MHKFSGLGMADMKEGFSDFGEKVRCPKRLESSKNSL